MTAVVDTADRSAVVRRLVAANAIVIAFVLAARPYVERLWNLRKANDWGSDWRWLEDGLDRLAAGLPLTRPEYVAGAWSQFPAPVHAPTYAWSLHPPYSATMYAPFMLAPDDIRNVVWAVAMVLTLGVAVWLAWPRKLWWGTGLLLVTLMLWLPDFGRAWPGWVDQLHYGNPNAVVILGLVLVWMGRRRDSVLLMAAGLVLTALKIAPAAALGCWLLVARERAMPARRAILVAAVVLGALSIPVLFLDPGAITDMLASQRNIEPWQGKANFAPQVRLADAIGVQAAILLSYAAAGGMLLLILLRRLDGPGGFVIAATAPLLITPQLWAHWFLLPLFALLVTAPEWRLVRTVDGLLRGAPDTPAAGAAASVEASAAAGAASAGRTG
jgi:hypothetical protein